MQPHDVIGKTLSVTVGLRVLTGVLTALDPEANLLLADTTELVDGRVRQLGMVCVPHSETARVILKS